MTMINKEVMQKCFPKGKKKNSLGYRVGSKRKRGLYFFLFKLLFFLTKLKTWPNSMSAHDHMSVCI